MPYKFNPFIGNLDFYTSGTGTGDVAGPGASTDRAIASWDGVTGTILRDNPETYVQEGGAIQASGFLTHRIIDTLITIPSDYTMLAANVDIEDGEIIIEEDGELLIL